MKILFKNAVKIKIIGKNIERFIKRLNNENIEMIEIEYINYKEINIKINKRDLEKIEKIKTIYEINVLELYGFDKIKQKIKNNLILILSVFVGCILIYFLSNTIFNVEVIHSNASLRNLIYEELDSRGIKKYKTKKNYHEIQKIKEEIILKYKDKIEWIEIEENGTTYIIRIEERIINNNTKDTEPRNIIAKKDAIIIDINGTSGEIIKNKNDYVKKGDVVISGEIKLNEQIKQNVRAEGIVYGEVWYKASVEYPLNYYEKYRTGKSKKVLTMTFLNKEFEFLNFNKYKNKEIKENTIIKNSLIPFKLSYNELYEIELIDQNLSVKEAEEKAIQEVVDKIESKFKDGEHVISVKCLKKEEKDSKIILELFITVCEDITDSEKINIEKIGEDNV